MPTSTSTAAGNDGTWWNTTRSAYRTTTVPAVARRTAVARAEQAIRNVEVAFAIRPSDGNRPRDVRRMRPMTQPGAATFCCQAFTGNAGVSAHLTCRWSLRHCRSKYPAMIPKHRGRRHDHCHRRHSRRHASLFAAPGTKHAAVQIPRQARRQRPWWRPQGCTRLADSLRSYPRTGP